MTRSRFPSFKTKSIPSHPLEAFKVRSGENLTSFQQGVGNGTHYKVLDFTRSGCHAESFASGRDDIIDKVASFLSDRFQGLGNDPILRAAATLTDHHPWPINNQQLMLIYGEDALHILSEHFEALLNQNHFNLQSCLDEWMEVKVHLQREGREESWSTKTMTSRGASFPCKNVTPTYS